MGDLTGHSVSPSVRMLRTTTSFSTLGSQFVRAQNHDKPRFFFNVGVKLAK